MTVRTVITYCASLLLLTGCGANLDLSTANLGLGASGSPQAAPTAASEVVIGTEPPDFDARSTGRHRGIARANCNSNSSVEEARQEALELLRRRAANNGADYIRLTGSGSIDERGSCLDGFFRLDGVGFAELTTTRQADSGMSPADTLTARLEELDALLERGLINQSEYDQLRQQVLDEAY